LRGNEAAIMISDLNGVILFSEGFQG